LLEIASKKAEQDEKKQEWLNSKKWTLQTWQMRTWEFPMLSAHLLVLLLLLLLLPYEWLGSLGKGHRRCAVCCTMDSLTPQKSAKYRSRLNRARASLHIVRFFECMISTGHTPH
jgi:hypothetical protein